MANTLRIKRRTSGSPGAPASLANAELAFNEVDDVLYYGKGTGGAQGSATTVSAIAGPGAYLTLSTTQSVSGDKTFSGTVAFTGSTSATTQSSEDNSTKVATTAFVKSLGFLTSANAVTSVGLSLPNIFSVSGSPVTTTGTLTASLSNQNPNIVFAGPESGSAGTPSFRSLVPADIPTLTASKISDFDTQVRTNRLDQMAAPTASVSLNDQKITNLAAPTSDTDAANKAYVDATAQGLHVHTAVRFATTEPLPAYTYANGTSGVGATITADSNGVLTIDGGTPSVGDRVLVKDETSGNAAYNGVYVVSVVGSVSAAFVLTRAVDFDQATEMPGTFEFVTSGNTNADSGWVCTADLPITVGTTAITFAQFSGAGQIDAGDGLTKVGNTLNVVTASSTRIVVNSNSIDLATTGVTAGDYTKVSVDSYGRVTVGSNPTTLSGYGITDAQPLDATLTALAGVTVAADQLIYATGADAFSTTSLTSFGRSLIDDADASAARTTLGLGTIATQDSSNVSITGGSIDNITFDCGTF